MSKLKPPVAPRPKKPKGADSAQDRPAKGKARSRSQPNLKRTSPVEHTKSDAASKANSVTSSAQHRVRMSTAERQAYYDRLSQPTKRRQKFTERVNSANSNADLSAEQIAHNERKARRDKRITQMWLDGIRPELRDKSKPEFVLKFDQNQDDETRLTTQHAEHKQQRAMESKDDERARLEAEWLRGLRNTIQDAHKQWNLSTEIARSPSPEKLFPSDDEDFI